MPGYLCFFFGPDSHITARDDYEAETDEVAIIEVRARYAESAFGNGFEVWQRGRLVYSAGRVTRVS